MPFHMCASLQAGWEPCLLPEAGEFACLLGSSNMVSAALAAQLPSQQLTQASNALAPQHAQHGPAAWHELPGKLPWPWLLLPAGQVAKVAKMQLLGLLIGGLQWYKHFSLWRYLQ